MNAVPDGSELADRTDQRLTIAANVSNATGTAIVLAFLVFLLPASRSPGSGYETMLVATGLGLALYLPASFYLGRRWGRRRFVPVLAWLRGSAPAGDVVQRLLLEYPMWMAKVSARFWGVAAVIFSALGFITASAVVGTSVLVTVILGGVTTSSVVYLMGERVVRPVVALALANSAPPRAAIPGVAARMTMAWTLATGVPLLGVIALAVTDLAGVHVDQDTLVAATLFLAVLAAAVGFLAILFAARGVANPIGSVRRELARIEGGYLDASVPVDDGSEVGLLQAGFNRMAAGLRERERLREAFGAFVDPGLTGRVLEEGIDLAGEEVELTVMFMDVRGFTTLSERAAAREVVAALNELYGVVVPIVLRHGGHANKFIGDGLLCVFGAPERLKDHADRAVAAAIEVSRAVHVHFAGDLRLGIGLNSGSVVAGTIGGGGRLDFTVIGDTVNTAARVETATRKTGDDILITDATRQRLRRDHGAWLERDPIPLKGKTQPVSLFAPPDLPVVDSADPSAAVARSGTDR
jgi:adenylate cyclase